MDKCKICGIEKGELTYLASILATAKEKHLQISRFKLGSIKAHQ